MTRTPDDTPGPTPAIAPGDDALHEALSAWMDGELDPDGQRFVLRRLGHDAALAARFERWQRVSLALRGEPAGALSLDFAGRVQRTLAAEAAAPAAQAPLPPTPPPGLAASSAGRRWRWPATGLAAAASLALALLWPAGGAGPPAVDATAVAPAPAAGAVADAPVAPASRGFDLDGLPEPVARPWPAASADTPLGRALEGRMDRHGGALTVGAAGAWRAPSAAGTAASEPDDPAPPAGEPRPAGDGAPPR